jgi:hypothetical protein
VNVCQGLLVESLQRVSGDLPDCRVLFTMLLSHTSPTANDPSSPLANGEVLNKPFKQCDSHTPCLQASKGCAVRLTTLHTQAD